LILFRSIRFYYLKASQNVPPSLSQDGCPVRSLELHLTENPQFTKQGYFYAHSPLERRIIMRRVLCFLLCSIAILFFLDGGRFSEAGDWFTPGPYGTYQVNLTRTCLDFNSDGSFRRDITFHTRGEATYDGDGRGSFEAELIAVDPSIPFVSTWWGNCIIEYVVSDRRNFTQELTCSFNLPSGTGPTLERTGIIIDGVITKFGSLLLLSDTDSGNDEITTVIVNDTVVDEFFSRCGRTGTAVRIRRPFNH
jgi:hypothetical protein